MGITSTLLKWSPGGIAGQLAMAAGIALAGAYSGWEVANWRRDSIDAERVAADSARAAHRSEGTLETVGANSKEKENAKVILRRVEVRIPTIVERTVYRDACVDADGLRELQGLIVTTGAKLPAGPVDIYDLSATRTSDRGDRARPVPLGGGDSGSIQAMPVEQSGSQAAP